MSTNSIKRLDESIKTIKSYLSEAYHNFYRSQNVPDHVYNEYEVICNYNIEKAFICTLVLLEALGHKDTYDKLDSLYAQAKKEGFNKSLMGVEDLYLEWAAYIDDYTDALGVAYNLDLKKGVISIDIISILKTAQYTITDLEIFKTPPSNEADVHLRIEGLLKSIFLDLKHKPKLTKPIKNFEPDTGIPSIKTLIEYKFLSSKQEAKVVADEILADTRGYYSRDWDRFIYVIYETTRIKPESEWKNLLSECNVEDTEVVVISGVPKIQKKVSKVNASKTKGRIIRNKKH